MRCFLYLSFLVASHGLLQRTDDGEPSVRVLRTDDGEQSRMLPGAMRGVARTAIQQSARAPARQFVTNAARTTVRQGGRAGFHGGLNPALTGAMGVAGNKFLHSPTAFHMSDQMQHAIGNFKDYGQDVIDNHIVPFLEARAEEEIKEGTFLYDFNEASQNHEQQRREFIDAAKDFGLPGFLIPDDEPKGIKGALSNLPANIMLGMAMAAFNEGAKQVGVELNNDPMALIPTNFEDAARQIVEREKNNVHRAAKNWWDNEGLPKVVENTEKFKDLATQYAEEKLGSIFSAYAVSEAAIKEWANRPVDNPEEFRNYLMTAMA